MPALLVPQALWFALGAVPLVLLYVLKTRRTRVVVSNAVLFAAAQREAIARDPWRRFRPEVALILQLLALILLVLSLGRPAWRSPALDADAVVIVLDRSASMASDVPGGSSSPRDARYMVAKGRALELLDRLGIGTEVAVVAAERKARLLAPLRRERTSAAVAIRSYVPTVAEGDLQPALDLTRDLLRARVGRTRVVVFTDGVLPRSPDWLDEPGGPVLEVVEVGGEPSAMGNVGIVRLDIRRGPTGAGADRVEVGAVLAAHGPLADRKRFVTLRRVDRPTTLDARQVEVNGSTTVTLGFNPTPDDELAVLAVELSPEDALTVDDWAHVAVPPPRALPVVLSSLGEGGGTWIGRALAADPEVRLARTTPDQLASFPVEPWSLIVVEGSCPKAAPGGGDVLIVNPPPGACAGRIVGDAVDGARLPNITSWSPTDPRLRFVNFEGVHLNRIHPLTTANGNPAQGAIDLGAGALVRAEQFAVMADASTLDRRVTLWGFDPSDGDLARKAAFVLLIRASVDTARGRRDQGWAPSARAGMPARIIAAPSTSEIVVRRMSDPGAGTIAARVPVVEGTAMVEGLEGQGPYALEGAATLTPLTISLLSDVESSIDRRVVIQHSIASATPKTIATAARERFDLRWLVALLAALLVAADLTWLLKPGLRGWVTPTSGARTRH